MRTATAAVTLVAGASAASPDIRILCANPVAHPDCHTIWDANQWTDHWGQYCAWFPETPGCEAVPTGLGLDDDLLGLGGPNTMPGGSALKVGDVQTAATTTTTAAPTQSAGNEGSVDFTLFSGPWKKEVIDLKVDGRDDVKWLNPVPGQHEYIEAMMDCSAWNAAQDPQSCEKRGVLKFLNKEHQVIGVSDAAHSCDSRTHNDWINSYTMPLPQGTHNVIAFAEGDKGQNCGPVYFTTKLMSKSDYHLSPRIVTLPAGRGAGHGSSYAVRKNDNTLTADVTCVDKDLTLPAWCRKAGKLEFRDQAGQVVGTPLPNCDSSDASKRSVSFSVDVPLGATSVHMDASKVDNDTIDCGRVRFLLRTWHDLRKTSPPTPAPTPAPTPDKGACTHLKCKWTGEGLHVIHHTGEWAGRHKCFHDPKSVDKCTCHCFAK